MKDVIKYFGTMAACAVGWMAGSWLWQAVLGGKDVRSQRLSQR